MFGKLNTRKRRQNVFIAAMEQLEPRLVLSMVFGTAIDGDMHPDHGEARGGTPGPPGGGGGTH